MNENEVSKLFDQIIENSEKLALHFIAEKYNREEVLNCISFFLACLVCKEEIDEEELRDIFRTISKIATQLALIDEGL